ncbi:hypothetical protein TrispH2_004688 [Trichoplax sp. H2]|uniref:Prokineticin domain-containing protein n=1 Tax=Trichoplax adhaerens TaxID=10228 RepID=B3S063_TRIAD|nr:expressed hypothetical protein [Trichoplax adhaerens]EDV23951.1 expressed hypothetical protein [Trichoplax adhaerens]RDD44199.1 hypothetical protein TrispH2_004688 [Trichoplax sp. H2]|eukprot:XP_002113477.1 expressed hypothetical protein [Trichoplax adhaerens]
MRLRAITLTFCLVICTISAVKANDLEDRHAHSTPASGFKKLKNLKYLVKWAPPTCNANKACPTGQCCSVYQPTLHTPRRRYCRPNPYLGSTCRLGTGRRSLCRCGTGLQCVPAYRHLTISGRSVYRSVRGAYDDLDEEIDMVRETSSFADDDYEAITWNDVAELRREAEMSTGSTRKRAASRLANVGICVRDSNYTP